MSRRNLQVCFVCTHSFSLATLCRGLFPWLEARGYEVHAVVGDDEFLDLDPQQFGLVKPHVIPMKRTFDPLGDFRAVAQLVALFRRCRFDVVHLSTPKAALLGAIAGTVTRTPALFLYRTCVYELKASGVRWLGRQGDRLIAMMCDIVVPVSRYFHRFLLESVGIPERKLRFIASGGSNGVDVERFSAGRVSPEKIGALKLQLGIGGDAPVLLYLGRLSREKGIDSLLPVLEIVRRDHPDTVLVVAGPDDERDPISEVTRSGLLQHGAVRQIAFTGDPSPFYAAADLILFPSFREGIPNVLLEAAAHEKAVVAFRIPGVDEVVVEGVTGRMVPVGDSAAMGAAVSSLLQHQDVKRSMELGARERAKSTFANRRIWAGVDALFQEIARVPQEQQVLETVARTP